MTGWQSTNQDKNSTAKILCTQFKLSCCQISSCSSQWVPPSTAFYYYSISSFLSAGNTLADVVLLSQCLKQQGKPFVLITAYWPQYLTTCHDSPPPSPIFNIEIWSGVCPLGAHGYFFRAKVGLIKVNHGLSFHLQRIFPNPSWNCLCFWGNLLWIHYLGQQHV